MNCPKCGSQMNAEGVCPVCNDLEQKKQDFKEHRERVIKKLSMDEIRDTDYKQSYVSEERLVNVSKADTQTLNLDEMSQMFDEDDPDDLTATYDKNYEYDLGYLDKYLDDDENDSEMSYIVDDDYETSINDASAKRLHTQHKKRKKKSAARIIVPGIIIILAICAAIGYFLYQWQQDQKLQEFKADCDAYYAAMKDFDAEYGAYKELFDTADKAYQDEDFAAFEELREQFKSMRSQMETEAGILKSLNDVKAEYANAFDKYIITEEYQATYDSLNQRLDDAIANRTEGAANDIKKEYESLLVNLKTADQQLIQAKLNEITKLDLAAAKESDKTVFDDYETQVTAATADDNYVEAMRLADLWLTSAQEVEKEIKESESIERARLESERIEREKAEAEKKRQQELKQQQQQAAGSNNTGTANAGTFIFADSNSRYLSSGEISGLTAEQKRLARNEIFARRGRMFNDASLQAYFNKQSWYHGTIAADQFSESVFNDFERKNIDLIKSME